MPPPLMIDLRAVDLTQILLSREEIYEQIPHRFEFQLLDGVCMLDRSKKQIITFSDIRTDAWWVRGHIPNRPLLPGVLMLEMAGQTAALAGRLLADYDAFIGFGGVDECRFRESVAPPTRLYLLCTGTEFRTRRITCRAQGVIDDRLIFEATITGLTMR